MTTLAFLDLILPDEGYRCAFIHHTKRNYFFISNAELADFVLKMDGAGNTVYHACATYKEASERKQTNVAAVRSLWADIDAGPGKPYPDAMAAARAVVAACVAAKLPVPLFVCSGRGLHIYWPLATDLPPSDWLSYAKGLRTVLQRAGLHFDPARSCDSASLLRPPGTHHRKETTPLPVVMGNTVPRYDLTLFAHVLEAQYVDIGFRACPDHLIRRAPEHIAAGISSVSSEPIITYSNQIAEQCGQVHRLRETRGNIAEPFWYACLGVLAFAADGDRYAHEWSSGYPRYSADETNKKLDQARRLTGATTCAHFAGVEPATCEACPHWQKIKSPISLGIRRDQPENQIQGDSLQQATTSISLPRLPRSFSWGQNNELLFTTESNHQPIEHLISTYPIYICDANEDETSRDHSLTFQAWLPAKGWFIATVSQKTLMQPGGINELDRFGINIHDGERFKKYIRDALDMYYHEGRLKIRYEQYGWKNNETTFLFGRKLYTKDDEFEVIGSDELEVRNQFLGPGCNAPKHNPDAYGLERWCNAANALFAKNCEPQAVALLCSAGSPMMRFQATEEGGAILSLLNHESSTGKTTGLIGAYSFWGDKKGLSLIVDDNRVTKWLTIAALGNLPVCHDELQMRDPNTLRDFVITFTNGRDKMRGTREGTIRHSKNDWQTILISASNTSLVDMLGGITAVNAPAFRVLELPCDIPPELKHEWGDRLKKELQLNAGYAGEVYSRFLVANVPFIRKGVEDAAAMLWERTKLQPAYRFWIRAAACMVVAGVCLRRLELLDFSLDYIIDWLVKFMVKSGGKQSKMYVVKDWVAESVSDFCLAENQNFVVLPHLWIKGEPRIRAFKEPRGQISGSYLAEERQLQISVRALRLFAVKHEIPYRKWLELLQERGIATEITYKSLTSGTDIPCPVGPMVTIDMTHEALAGANKNISVDPERQESNVTPLRR